jgi:hypothetical protein
MVGAEESIPAAEIEEVPTYVISAADPRSIQELVVLRAHPRAGDREWMAKIERTIRDFELYSERR